MYLPSQGEGPVRFCCYYLTMELDQFCCNFFRLWTCQYGSDVDGPFILCLMCTNCQLLNVRIYSEGTIRYIGAGKAVE